MTAKISTGLRNSMLDSESFKASMDDCVMKIYAGTVPDDADAAIGGATLLCVVSDNALIANEAALPSVGNGLDWASSASAGVIQKSSTQTWKGTNENTGTASFFRIVQQSDDGTLSTVAKRIQGNISTVGADLNLSSTSLSASATLTINSFSATLPA